MYVKYRIKTYLFMSIDGILQYSPIKIIILTSNIINLIQSSNNKIVLIITFKKWK